MTEPDPLDEFLDPAYLAPTLGVNFVEPWPVIIPATE